ncbi:tropomyosin Cha f 1.0101-like [Tigriopus californicus]|uniref:tropomyosin Cha f 1.0101-like n=1 Tax=Tigriopus californicus TaxID=6832 RepID=UPI0027DA0576|nr:tropomyosin Cha f 1.0101-like [Tigriopus californicus]|eukprot:TCALIF_07060-PA protein Name:"Similar to TM1 Tropomyosin (Penaeus monodon)" AED:0.07 eAED:0.07 QI:131/1/1/1/1/1/4/46/286
MDSIKKKMTSLSQATDEANTRAQEHERETRQVNEVADKSEEQIRNIQKKMQALEGQLDSCTEKLFDVTTKYEDKEKHFSNAEGDVGALTRRVVLLEEEVDRSERHLANAITDLAKHSQRADHAVKKRQQLENFNTASEEQCDKLEYQYKEDKFTLAESERKYDDIARKLHGKEEELLRGNERCEACERKIIDLEEELQAVGQNLQQLEVSEEKALKREETYLGQMKSLNDSLKSAENREENATMNIQRLNIRIDQVEEDLLCEKLKIKQISDDLNITFENMLSFTG